MRAKNNTRYSNNRRMMRKQINELEEKNVKLTEAYIARDRIADTVLSAADQTINALKALVREQADEIDRIKDHNEKIYEHMRKMSVLMNHCVSQLKQCTCQTQSDK